MLKDNATTKAGPIVLDPQGHSPDRNPKRTALHLGKRRLLNFFENLFSRARKLHALTMYIWIRGGYGKKLLLELQILYR